jgi:excisionase family DNA binding protein
MDKEILTVEDLAQYLQITSLTVYRWVRVGKIPHIKLGGKAIRFRKVDIDEWLKSKTQPAKENGKI